MRMRVCTFNVQGLYSGYSAQRDAADSDRLALSIAFDPITGLPSGAPDVTGPGTSSRSLVEREILAGRIRAIDADLLCMQQVEHEAALVAFNKFAAGGSTASPLYPHSVYCPARDSRLAGLGILSRFPIGSVNFWGHLADNERFLTRGPIEAEVLSPDADTAVLLLFVVHLADELLDGRNGGNLTRRRQHEVAALSDLLARRAARRKAVAVVGCFGANPDTPGLTEFGTASQLELYHATANAQPTAILPEAPFSPWTVCMDHDRPARRFVGADQIWLSPYLADRIVEARIGRRTAMAGDGTQHDPAWVTVNASGVDPARFGSPATNALQPRRRNYALPLRASRLRQAHQVGPEPRKVKDASMKSRGWL